MSGYVPPVVRRWLIRAGLLDEDGEPVLLPFSVDLSAADIATLHSVPIETVVEQGAGKAIVPVEATFHYKAGSEPFATNPNYLRLAAISFVLGEVDTVQRALESVSDVLKAGLHQTTDTVTLFAPLSGFEPAEYANLPLYFVADPESGPADPGLTGSILTSSVSDGGADYAEDDEITLNGLPPGFATFPAAGGVPAVLVVDTVDGLGAVLTYHMTNAGTRYALGDAGASVDITEGSTTGAGSGFILAVETITPLSDGTGRISGLYRVVDLLA